MPAHRPKSTLRRFMANIMAVAKVETLTERLANLQAKALVDTLANRLAKIHVRQLARHWLRRGGRALVDTLGEEIPKKVETFHTNVGEVEPEILLNKRACRKAVVTLADKLTKV